MSDLYSLLKQSIIDRDLRNAPDREQVYAQARRAMIKRLLSFSPPLAQAEIDTRIGAFDTAVNKIESDLVVLFGGARKAERPKRSLPPTPKPSLRAAIPAKSAPPPEIGDEFTDDDIVPAQSGWVPALRQTTSNAAQADWAREDIEAEEPAYEPAEPVYEPEEPRSTRDEPRLYREEQAEPDEDADDLPNSFLRRAALAEEAEQVPRFLTDDEDYGYGDDAVREPPPARRETKERRPPRQPRERRALPGAGALSGLRGLSEGGKIKLLSGIVVALFVLLLGFLVYVLFLRGDTSVSAAQQPGVTKVVTDATAIPAEKLDTSQSFVVFDGRDPTVFQGTSTNPVRFEGDTDGGFAIISSSTGSQGVKALIGPGVAGRLAGRNIRVTMEVRAAREGGAANLRFAYQTGLAISHWQAANLTTDYEKVGMVWRVPAQRGSANGDFLLIEPGVPGDGTAADIKSIKIDVLAS